MCGLEHAVGAARFRGAWFTISNRRKKAQKGCVDFSLAFDGQTEMCESSNKLQRVFLKGFMDSVVFGGEEGLYVTIESAVI